MRLGTYLGVVVLLAIVSFLAPFLNHLSLEPKESWGSIEPHAFFSNKKMSLNKASFKDFYMIDGISFNLAKLLDKYLTTHPSCNVSDLINVKGVGEKKLIVLKKHFF